MRKLRKLLTLLFVCMFASMSLFAGAGTTVVAEGRTMTFHCDPVDGMTVDEVDTFDDLEGCGLVDANTPVPDGKVAVVVVVGDMAVPGHADYEAIANGSWNNGVVNGTFPTEPVPDGEWYMARGDLLSVPDACQAVIFHPGETVPMLPNTTWSLVRIFGGSDVDKMAVAEDLREKSYRAIGGESDDCPWISPADLNGYEPSDNSPSTPSSNTEATREDLGHNEYQGAQLELPGSVPDGSYLVLHGDADPQRGGQCSIMVFGPGESPTGYSAGSWDAFYLHGGDESSYTSLETTECPITRTPA